VIYVNWTYPDACGIARVARALGVPVVCSISGSDANSYLKFPMRRKQILRMLAEARAVTVRSRALQKLLASHGVPTNKVHVLYNGVDRAQFTPLPHAEVRRSLKVAPTTRLLLYVGHLRIEKGVADLLDALAMLRNDRVELLVVGDGPEHQALHGKCRALGLNGRVQWAGRKRAEEIVTFMSAAALVCLPSHMEGVPNAALEAFACGVPVVATAVGGIPELTTDQTGMLAEPHDPRSFAAALTQALDHRWDANSIRAHAARFDWNENARQLFQVLEHTTR